MGILEFIDARLDAMLAHPLAWGGAESFELQVLLLLELRFFLDDPAAPRSLTAAYSEFLRASRPDLGARPLSAATEDCEDIAKMLARFRAELARGARSAAKEPPC